MASVHGTLIDSLPPPPVKSLRSKFEQLALETNMTPSRQGFLAPDSTNLRPRAVSSSDGQHVGAHHLRSSSSSSDLESGCKRPPPPPPPRVSKAGSPSPSPSPLLRPVPIPNTLASTSNSSLSATFSRSSSMVFAPSVSDGDSFSTAPSDSVASLRNKFSNSSIESSSRSYTSKQSLGGIYPSVQPEERIATQNAPVIPPRPIRSTTASLASPISRSPHAIYSPSTFHTRLQNKADSDSDSSESPPAPPALPARQSKTVVTLNINHKNEVPFDRHSTSSSPESGEINGGASNYNLAQPTKSSRRSVPPPPRPPLRSPAPVASSPCDSPSTLASPPPLPLRRISAIVPVEPNIPPRLPVRPNTVPAVTSSHGQSSVPSKPVGVNKLPPPPTRTIALGDKLPPARRPPSPSSDEESGDEDDTKTRSSDYLPDSSRSSRRPPVLSIHEYSEHKIQVPAYTGHVAISGEYVVASQNHVKVFNLSKSDAPLYSLNAKDVGLKDLKVTAMEFQHSAELDDSEFFLLLGTKDGHLIEMDVRTGCIVGTKLVAHSHQVTHIFRHGPSMITLDHGGKTLIFTPDGSEDLRLGYTQPRVARIAEKQEFAKMLGGLLWTSARTDMNVSGTAGKAPIIRVYDVFSPGIATRSLLPTEHVGAVTSGTVLPSQPDRVYLGHEGGFISMWEIDGEDGFPRCIEVVKVSVSDVLSLEGVNERLWAGGRKGMISAYDVTSRPWVVTNCWMAHNDLPVMKLTVDHSGIQKTGRLPVVSVGRDEQIRFWDGLLGSDWIDHELLKQEMSFSSYRELTVLLISWNVDAARPDSLTDDAANVNFIQDVLKSVDSPDIIVFGLQEVVDLESRSMTAKNVLLGSKKKEDSGISEKVTTGYKRWHDYFLLGVRSTISLGYTVTHTENLVGLFSCVMMKNSYQEALQDVAVTTIKRGMGGRYGNKGAIVARFVIEDSSICFINCHLAAGQSHVRQRNADVAAILEGTVLPATRSGQDAVTYAGGGDGSMIHDHEIVFVSGDMNYRIERRDHMIASIKTGDYESLVHFDQLMKEMKHNRGFRLRKFTEGPITFAPTYKYDRRSSEYDSSEKGRTPAWCDRILWRSCVPSRVRQLNYRRYEANISDHRPISAGFTITVKSVRHEMRAQVKRGVEMRWSKEQERLLTAAREFYISQALI